jgi:heterodisulfide reductase subunit B
VKYAFFPGCSLESTAWDYDRSTRAVCRALGIELEEIPGWVCCGSTPGHATSPSLSIALPVFNLQRARELQAPVLTACASCYARLRTANHEVRNDANQRQRAERITREPYDGSVEVHHVLDVLVNHLGVKAIRAAVRRPLAGLRVACYYGCLLVRPAEVVAFDAAEHPTAMDRLVAALGAEPIDWPLRTECCGASLSMTQSGVVSRLSYKLVDMARQAGAQCIAVACPLCQVNLDLRQADARKAHGELLETPALYVTQLLGLALGLTPKELGLRALSVSADALLEGLASPTGRGKQQELPSPVARGAGGESSGSQTLPDSSPHPNPLPKGEGTSGANPFRDGEGTIAAATGGTR